jgi:pyruvate kinase
MSRRAKIVATLGPATASTEGIAALLTIARLEKGDKVVIVAGSPPGTPGKTNALRVHRIGDAVALPDGW